MASAGADDTDGAWQALHRRKVVQWGIAYAYHGERGKQRVTVTGVVTVSLLAAAGVLFSVAATSA